MARAAMEQQRAAYTPPLLSSLFQKIEPLLWIGPGLLVFFVFVHLPIILQLAMSFASGVPGSGEGLRFISLGNFRTLLADVDYWASILNNIQFAIATVVGKLVLSLMLALALNSAFIGQNIFRTIFFLPVILSFVAIGVIWGFMFQFEFGAINQMLARLGLNFLIEDWLGDPRFALWSIVVVDIWKWTGFHMVIYLAGLQALPKDLTEAASVDGATAWQRLVHITLPLLSRYTATNVIIATLGAFSVFDLIYVMTQGGPFGSTQVAMMQVYLQAFQFHRLGYASTQATVLLAIIAIVSIVVMRLSRRPEDEEESR
ncbi:carbohydrate ABC transporter membrane protein 1, CUT1 family [Kaistia soli DSM 19436]|uniref:Carbohydrate ABC transporter membrane protein 1, CUT1 family n=1 Tax=Kaistia soli DSM 19436 TaxID=1122133 RepID=A0A1M5PDK5_9HYPH|nr:sugar ABC transporter permease [Kaistia soli]SHG99851.1 carbohydrate ABC transporter membrane protein 1, CUT1 family [Kaistia soli DSM 19436]